jgi:hypothetical protein
LKKKEGRLPNQFRKPVHKNFVIQTTMGPMPILKMLPFLKLIYWVFAFQVGSRIKFIKNCLLRPLNFSVQMRRTRLRGAKFDMVFKEPLLDLVSEEFSSTIGLNS